jgi:valyl-tRNA synthetase
MTQSSIDLQNLPSQYDHQAAQAKWYKVWEERGYFHAEVGAKDADGKLKPPYVIVIPPPNVTGALHLGHALNNTLQDILIRMKRMQGFNTLWMPGTDHAGIATQAVVERRLLEEEKLSRHDLGREGLVARIWQWKEQYEARIISQLKQLGCSCDWARTQFTFNEHNSRAVRETFFRLFSDGKIYRGKRLVNWDTFLQTAVSDDEVFHETVKGSFWHFRYPVVRDEKWRPDEPEFVTIATTRPETMLGDTAVAVHPDPGKAFDKVSAELREKMLAAPAKEKGELEEQADLLLARRAKMLPLLEQLRDMAVRGVKLELPLTGRQIPLIADEWAKPELGSGCVKITPAHDANDYEVGQRHPEIGTINIMNADGTLNDSVPAKYRGLTMKKARDAVVADMEATTANGVKLFDPEKDCEDREIDLAHSDRSKTPIEPYLADQWFVKMDKLAQSAMDAVADGRVRITPERYAKSYLDWLGEKRDWPVGRQLWWGHRIPVWEAITTSGGVVDENYRAKELKEQEDAIKAFTTYLEACGLRRNEFAIEVTEPWKIRICSSNKTTDDALNALKAFHDSYKMNLVQPGKPIASALREVPGFEAATSAAFDVQCSNFLKQDEEVLDTWFSSALWPHSTLGWPDQTPELAAFYPTSTLVTSRDIISLWVARMVLMGLYNMKDVPFHEVYITPKILDGYGETMSKSKGNGVDPIDVIEIFGADALRYGIAYLTTDTQDVKMPVEFECPHCQHLMAQTKKNRTLPRVECEKCGQPFSTQWAEKAEDKALPRAGVSNERFELGRRFCNKLWNASRFSLMNLSDSEPGRPGAGAGGETPRLAPIADGDLMLEDRWLLSRLATVTREVTEQLETYRFAEASRTLYGFAWNDFCDYYVEITKERLNPPVGGVSDADASGKTKGSGIGVGDASHKSDSSHKSRAIAQRLLAHVLDSLLRLLHPIVPFLTEEVWQLLNRVAPDRGLAPTASTEPSAESICIAAWPMVDEARIDSTIEEQFADFQAVLGAVREIRMGQNIPPRTPIEFCVRCKSATARLLEPMRPYFAQIAEATCTALGPDAAPPERSVSKTLGEIDVHVDVSAFFDVDAEKARLAKEIVQLRGHAESIDKKLSNESFVSRAPADVVQQQRDKLVEVRGQLEAATTALAKLS